MGNVISRMTEQSSEENTTQDLDNTSNTYCKLKDKDTYTTTKETRYSNIGDFHMYQNI
jgi:hypothetical protein